MPTLSRRTWSGLLIVGIGYLVCIHAILIVLVFKTDFLLLAGKTLGRIPPEEWNPALYSTILQQAKQDTRTTGSHVILLGDSLIAHLNADSISEDAVNFGVDGDTTHTLYSRLPVLHSVAHSRAIVVGVGVNDLKYRPVDEIARDYARLLERLSEVPHILVLSVLPVDESGEAARRRPYLRNQTIQALNHDLRLLCDAHANCQYLNAWPMLAPANRAQSESATYASDGWHLSSAGSRMLADFIRNSLPSP